VVIGALGLAACGNGSPSNQGASSHATTSIATTTTTTAPLALDHEASRQSIPWKQVGAGWALALWDSSAPAQPEQPPTTVPGESASLYLINPDGGRYLVANFPADNFPNLASWSGDGRRALLVQQSGSGETSGTQVTEIDLASGAIHSISLPESMAVTYSNPSGLALLATDQINTVLQRLSTDGAVELSYPTQFGALGAFNGSSRESPDGTQIAIGTHGGGIALVDNAGQVTSNLVIAGTSYCSPVRWWAASEVLVSCAGGTTGISTLWLVPTSGAEPTAVTVSPPAGGQDNGDEDAWQAGGSTYLQDAGACGYQYLAVLDPDHTTSPVTVPGVGDNVSQLILGAVGDQLLIHTANSCGAGISLLWYDPQSNLANVVLGPGANGGNVMSALLFGDDN
jgi:TolB protein